MGVKLRFTVLVAVLGTVAFATSLWLQQSHNTVSAGGGDVSGNPAGSNAKTVTVGSPITTLPATDLGINTAVWDSHLLDKTTQKLMKKAGIHVFRYPGGSTADVYHWQTNSIEPSANSTASPRDAFPQFMQYIQKSHSQAVITVNYGTGTPQEAAAWVKYATVTHHYNVKYWEIGNEVYGNGTYGTQWEADSHANIGPKAYAQNALNYIHAMKQANPAIKVGVNLIAPGQWPSNQQPNWNQTVLQTVGKDIDFVDVHWYPQEPGQESDKGLLHSTTTIPEMMKQLHSLIQQYCGQNARHVQVMVSETNSVAKNPGKQTTSMVNALFLVNDVMTWLQQGAINVDWWDLHNSESTGGNNSSSLFGRRNYGDYGILSTGSHSQSLSQSKSESKSGTDGSSKSALIEPPLNTPFPTYYALELLSRLGQPGDTLLHVRVNSPNVSAHAVRRKNGTVGVLLVNKDPKQSLRVKITIPHSNTLPITRVYSYGPKQENKIRSGFGLSTVTVPPYSMKLVVLKKW